MINKKLLITSAATILCLQGLSPANGQSTYFSEQSKNVAKLGVQGNFFYVTFLESIQQNCLNGVLYISSDRKGLYVQLLSSKLSGKRLSRVDYSQPGGNGTSCNVELVEIE